MNLESGRRWTENAFPFNTGEKWVQISSTSNNFLRIACGNLFHFDDIIWKRRAFFSRHYARVLSVISFSVPLTSRPELRSRRVRMIIRIIPLKWRQMQSWQFVQGIDQQRQHATPAAAAAAVVESPSWHRRCRFTNVFASARPGHNF